MRSTSLASKIELAEPAVPLPPASAMSFGLVSSNSCRSANFPSQLTRRLARLQKARRALTAELAHCWCSRVVFPTEVEIAVEFFKAVEESGVAQGCGRVSTAFLGVGTSQLLRETLQGRKAQKEQRRVYCCSVLYLSPKPSLQDENWSALNSFSTAEALTSPSSPLQACSASSPGSCTYTSRSR